MADDASKPNVKKTTVHHVADKRFVGVTPDGQQVMIDGEEYAKTGMNPMELLLNAVGACAAFDVVERSAPITSSMLLASARRWRNGSSTWR